MQVSIEMEATPTCVAMRAVALELLLAQIDVYRSRSGSTPIVHVDWGAATGAFARAAAEAVAGNCSGDPSRALLSRSFSSRSPCILPALLRLLSLIVVWTCM